MTVSVTRGRWTIEFQYRGQRIFRRLPACATEDDAKALEEKMRRQIFEDAALNGKTTPGQRAAMHKLDPSEWTRIAGLLLTAGPIKPRSGVYFLCSRGRVVYIGKSKNVATRLSGHFDKSFDHVCMIEVPPSELAAQEQYLISMLQPKLNVHHAGGRRASGWTGDGLAPDTRWHAETSPAL